MRDARCVMREVACADNVTGMGLLRLPSAFPPFGERWEDDGETAGSRWGGGGGNPKSEIRFRGARWVSDFCFPSGFTRGLGLLLLVVEA